MCLKCVSNERLEKKLAEGLPVIFGIDRPELVHQRTYSQPAYLLEHNHGRTDGECSGAEKRMSSSRVEKGGANTPNQSEWSRMFGARKRNFE